MTEPSRKNMRLYQGAGPNSYRVRIFLAEKGLDVPREEVDIFRGEQRAPDYSEAEFARPGARCLSSTMATVITESIAICRYFEALHPKPALFGADPVECGKVEMWNRRAEIVVFGTIGNVALHTSEMFSNRLTQFPAFAETERKAVPRKWEWLDGEIADGRPFLAGENFSVADITGAVAAWLGDFFGMPVPDSLGHVNRWRERVTSRPSWNA